MPINRKTIILTYNFRKKYKLKNSHYIIINYIYS